MRVGGVMGLLIAAVIAYLLWQWLRVPESPRKPSRPAPLALQPLAPLVPDGRDVPFPLVSMQHPAGTCAVCRSHRPVRFVTPRIHLCQWCVSLLKASGPFDVQTMQRVVWRTRVGDPEPAKFVNDVLNQGLHEYNISRYMDRLHLQAHQRGHRNDWRKILRAHQLGLIADGTKLARPSEMDWLRIAKEVRHQDGGRCLVCGAHNGELHVHHMIPLSNFGSNDPRNLITLCYVCHRAQHPGFYFSLGVQPDVQTDIGEER